MECTTNCHHSRETSTSASLLCSAVLAHLRVAEGFFPWQEVSGGSVGTVPLAPEIWQFSPDVSCKGQSCCHLSKTNDKTHWLLGSFQSPPLPLLFPSKPASSSSFPYMKIHPDPSCPFGIHQGTGDTLDASSEFPGFAFLRHGCKTS